MQLTPSYGPDPIITLDGDPSAIAAPVARQRQRLAEVLGSFTEEQWAHPSRCAGWSNREVITHLHTTNTFWGFSVGMGLKGEPTQFLATFDPVASPAQFVADAPTTSPAELLHQFTASNDAFAVQLASLDEAGWAATAEAPCGHVSIATLAHHALWDSLIHERDILLPVGIDPVEEADETLAALRYAAALGPAFALSRSEAPGGVLAIEPTEPAEPFVVTVTDHVDVRAGSGAADVTLRGPAVDLLEALSLRAPLEPALPADASWWTDGLKVTFDQAT